MSSATSTFIRLCIACSLAISFFAAFEGYRVIIGLLAAIAVGAGFFLPVSVGILAASYCIFSLLSNQLPSVWTFLLALFPLLVPKGSFFNLKDYQNYDAGRVPHIFRSIYMLILLLLAGAHLLTLSMDALRSPLAQQLIRAQDPWYQAFPFFSGALLACVQLVLVLWLIKSSFSFTSWLASFLLTLCTLIFAPSIACLSLLTFHFILFKPKTIAPDKTPGLIIYDGECGLCHHFVQFCLKENSVKNLHFVSFQDPSIESFTTAYSEIPFSKSVVYIEKGSPPVIRMEAVLEVFFSLGGLWALLAKGLSIVPLPWLNTVYRGVACIRHKFFARPQDPCPLTPKELSPLFQVPEDFFDQ